MRTLLPVFLLLACNGNNKTDDSGQADDTSSQNSDAFSTYIYVEEAPTGDLTCFDGGFEATGAWTIQEPLTELISDVSMTGSVIDFESDNPVEEARVEIFWSNEVYGQPDVDVESDASGAVSGMGKTCTPYSYRVSTDPDLAETKVTIEANQIDGFGSSVNTEFNSVSRETYAVIPSLLGISPDPAKGIVAGTMHDCSGTAFAGAQIIIRGADGSIPSGVVVKYFVNDFPNRNQLWTSDDGLFVAINVPVGEWVAESYVSDGQGGHLLMGATTLSVVADSINISSIYASLGDGIAYPDSCLASVDPNDVDDDGDGQTENEGDCNDADSTIYSGAPEIPDDGIDQDCNGTDASADPGDTDDDGDGFTENQGDCDDTSAAAYPGAAPSDSTTACLLDADGDGYGANVVIGTITPGTDCDDSNAAINPAAVDTPGDGIDQDCDGSDASEN